MSQNSNSILNKKPILNIIFKSRYTKEIDSIINEWKSQLNIIDNSTEPSFTTLHFSEIFLYINTIPITNKTNQFNVLAKIYTYYKRKNYEINYEGLTLNDINDYNIHIFFEDKAEAQALITYRKRTFRTDNIEDYSWIITHKEYYKIFEKKPSELKTQEITHHYNCFTDTATCDRKTYSIINKFKKTLKELNIMLLRRPDGSINKINTNDLEISQDSPEEIEESENENIVVEDNAYENENSENEDSDNEDNGSEDYENEDNKVCKDETKKSKTKLFNKKEPKKGMLRI